MAAGRGRRGPRSPWRRMAKVGRFPQRWLAEWGAMRIGLITHTTAGRGGIEKVVQLQVQGLRSRGHEVLVLSGPELGAGWSARAVAAAGLAARPIGALRECDVLLAHYPPAPWLAARSGVPFVHYFHCPL